MLNWLERIYLNRLKRRIIRWEKRQKIITQYIKQDKKEVKRLLIKDVDDMLMRCDKP